MVIQVCSISLFQFEVPEVLQREDVLKTHNSERFGFANIFIHSLCILQGLLKQYERYINGTFEDY